MTDRDFLRETLHVITRIKCNPDGGCKEFQKAVLYAREALEVSYQSEIQHGYGGGGEFTETEQK